MRNRFFGAIMALAAGAGLAWGQVPPGGPLPGRVTQAQGMIIPPQLPGGLGGGGMPPAGPGGAIGYPPPGNYEGFDPNGSPGGPNGTQGGPEAPHVWFGAEYLMWFTKGASFQTPLVSQSAPVDAGIIGQTNGSALYPTDNVAFNLTSGFRVNLGAYLDPSRRYGFQASGFMMEKRSNNFTIESQSTGSPLIALPFRDAQSGAQTPFIISNTGVNFGAVSYDTSTRTWGADGGFLVNLYRSAPNSAWGCDLSAVVGVQFTSVQESVEMLARTSYFPGQTVTFNNQTFIVGSTASTSTVTTGAGIATRITTTTVNSDVSLTLGLRDHFRVVNEFYGGQLGLNQEFRYGRFTLNAIGKVGLGDMHSTASITGSSVLDQTFASTVTQTITTGGGIVLSSNQFTGSSTNRYGGAGGLRALRDNIGKSRRDAFAVIPDITFNLGYQFTPSISGFIGYNFIYMNNVVRPSELVPQFVNTSFQPTSPNYGAALRSATPELTSTDFWIQGINFGFNVRY